MSTTYPKNTLIITHLPDKARNGLKVPVSGIVVRPGSQESIIKVRDFAGNIREIAMSNEALSKR